MISTPLGTAIGGPLVAGIGATETLVASGAATIALAGVASVLWKERGEPGEERGSSRPGPGHRYSASRGNDSTTGSPRANHGASQCATE
jgi:hypothetical protein